MAQLVAGRVFARKTVSYFAPINTVMTVFFSRFMIVMEQLDCHNYFLVI